MTIGVREFEIDLSAVWKRLTVVLLLGGALLWGMDYLSARVHGQLLAFTVGDVNNLRTALTYYPAQPDVHSRLGLYHLYNPLLFDPAEAVRHFEAAVRLEPFHSRAWSNLGRGYEELNDLVRAEAAYRLGIDLAPHHFNPHWAYANFLLRQGDLDRAFGEFRRVVEIYPDSSGIICESVWQASGGDVAALFEFGTQLHSAKANWGMTRCLMERQEFQSSVDLWTMMPSDDSLKVESGRSLIPLLTQANQWSLAHHVWKQVVSKEVRDVSPSDLVLWNGGFEVNAKTKIFDWSFSNSDDVEVSLDSWERQQGQQSLLIDFKQHQNVKFDGVSHTLWVEPSKKYRFRFYYKTDGIPQDNGIAIILTDAEVPDRFRAQSTPLIPEQEWTSQEIVLETPAETRFIRLRIVRRPVGKIYDYIEGKIWFDSFSLNPAEEAE